MKTKTLALTAVLLVSASVTFSQSVVVTGKETTYTRPKPLNEYKQSFTINYPKVKAATPALSRKIENALSYKTVLGLKLKEEIDEYQWLQGADFEVEYNKNGLLGVKLFMEGSGAYPSGKTRRVLVDTRTGALLRPADLFTNLPRLTAMVRKAHRAEVAAAILELKKDPENTDVEGTFKNSAKFQPLKLDQMTISDKGVMFRHDYDFAHVIKAWEPDGEYMFTWAQLRPYFKHDGPLAAVAR